MGATKQPGPRLIDYQYDTAGRLTTTTFPLGSITRTYDTAGRLAQVAGPTGVTMTYGYDGSLLKTIGWSGAITGSVERTFDSDFRVVGETVGGAWPVAFGYDADSLLTSAGGLQLFRDPLNGRLTGTKIGQVADTYTYDSFGQVQTYSASFGVTPLLSFAYVRDDLGRIVSKTETEGGVSKVFGYSYDTVGRLIEVSENGVVTESYEYDLNGNRTQSFNSAGSFAATFDSQDRILTYGSLTFTWTPNGEMASKTDTATGEVTTYSYDALGNLREVVLPDGYALCEPRPSGMSQRDADCERDDELSSATAALQAAGRKAARAHGRALRDRAERESRTSTSARARGTAPRASTA